MKRMALFLIMLACAATLAQDLPQIAVYVTGDVPPGKDKRIFGARLLSAIANTGRYAGMERPGEFFAEVERLRTEEYGGTINDAQVCKLGKRFGAGYICIAGLTYADDAYKINARIVDVKTTKTVVAGEADSPLQTAEELASALKIVIEKMLGEKNTQTPEPADCSILAEAKPSEAESTGQDSTAAEPEPTATVNNDSTGANTVNTAIYNSETDNAIIEHLFGAYNPDTVAVTKVRDTVWVHPTFYGNHRVLIARPVYALYDDEEYGTEWISAMAEIYAHYKAASFPHTHVFTMEDLDNALPNSRDYGRITTRQSVIDAAKRLNATHILFQEYQPLKNDTATRYIMELYLVQEDDIIETNTKTIKTDTGAITADTVAAVTDTNVQTTNINTITTNADTVSTDINVAGANTDSLMTDTEAAMADTGAVVKYIKTILRDTATVFYLDFERGLDSLLGKIADVIDPKARNTTAFRNTFMGGDRELIESFGDILAGEGSFTRANAITVYSDTDSLIAANPKLVGMRYAAALLAGRAGKFSQAVNHINAVIAGSGDYPALYLRAAEYLRGAKRYDEAVSAAETAAQTPALSAPATMEMAMILQASGDQRARAVYESILLSNESNNIAFFRAALMAAESGDSVWCDEIINRAEASGFNLTEDEYYQLGTAFAKIAGSEVTALNYLEKSLGPTKTSERSWLAVADIFNRTENREVEADIYVHLFRSNWRAHGDTNTYSEKLKLAGNIYDTLGLLDKAKETYTLFLNTHQSDLEVSISLAHVLVKQQECQTLRKMFASYWNNPEIARMFGECGFKITSAGDILPGKKLSPRARIMRISGPALAGIGLFGGIIYNERVKTEAIMYNNFGSPLYPKGTGAEHYNKVQEMRKNIDSAAMMRNLLYGVMGAGLGLLTASYYF